MMTTSKKTILTAITAVPLLALGGGLAYANTGGGTPPAPAVTTATTARTATPALAPGAVQHPAVGNWHYNGGRWCCDDTHVGYQTPAAQHRASQGHATRIRATQHQVGQRQATRVSGYRHGSGYRGNGQHGYDQRFSHHGHGDGCRDW